MKSIKTTLRLQLIVVFVMLFQTVKAQYFEFSWTDEMKYTNSKTGFFQGFVGANSSYTYALNSNYASTSINEYNKVRLVAYSKATMTEQASIPLKGFQENKGTKVQFERLKYFKTVVLDGKVMVFWTKLINSDSTKTEELYIETFKEDLEREHSLRMLTSVTQKVDVHQSEFALPSYVILVNNELGSVFIGRELHTPGKNLEFVFSHLEQTASLANTRSISLPTICEETQNGIVSGYELGIDGNIYIRSTVTLSRDEIRLQKPTDPKTYLVLTVVDPSSMEKAIVELRDQDKTITDYSVAITDSTARVLGFFGDLTKDPTGIDKQGIFYADLKSDSLRNTALSYSYFERTSLKKLFPKSKGGRKKKVENPTEEELNTRFDIEKMFTMEDGSVVMFFTRKYNYAEITSRSGMDGNNIYKTDNYCEKNNVSAIRFSPEGKIVWTGNIERTKTYEGTDIADVRVIYRSNKFYVMYGTEPAKKSKRKKKSLDLREVLEYATFDPNTGKGKILELEVNPEKTPKEDRKAVDPNSIVLLDGKFYYSKMVVKLRPEWLAANILFFPSIYYSVLSGNTKSAKGELGVITLQDGKPPKKR